MEKFGVLITATHYLKLKKNELNKYTNWDNIRPMYMKDNVSKGSKIDNLLYLMQEIKAKYFMKINGQEGLN